VKRPGPSSAPTGRMYTQNPAGGTLLPPGSAVTIYVQPATPLAWWRHRRACQWRKVLPVPSA